MRPLRQRGITLVELLVGMLIVGILLAMATPSFREVTRSNRVTEASTSLVTAFNLARSESLKRSEPISVCASANGATCGTADDWVSGWLVFQDGSGVIGELDATDVLLQAWAGPGGDIRFNSGEMSVQYQPTGTIRPRALVIDVFWENCSGPQLRRVSVGLTGTVQTARRDCP